MIELIKNHGYIVFIVGLFVESYYIHMYLKRIHSMLKPRDAVVKRTKDGRKVIIAPGKHPAAKPKSSAYIPSKDVDAIMSGKIVDPFD